MSGLSSYLGIRLLSAVLQAATDALHPTYGAIITSAITLQSCVADASGAGE